MVRPPSILVVGAGPVGLTAALELTRLGAAVRIVDRRDHPTAQSRAIAVNPRTLDLLEPSGATPRLLEAGVRLRGIRLFSQGRVVATIDATRIPHRYAFLLSLPQRKTERILETCLAERGVRVERGIELDAFEVGHTGVEVRWPGADGRVAQFDWLVGADGTRSAVRKTMGASFPGERYPFEWSLADIAVEGDVEPDRGELHLDPGRPVLFRVPIGDGLHRVISNGPDVLGRLPAGWTVQRTVWASSFSVSHRLADRIHWGRAVLVGDAAHIHSPAGGRGMNLGIEDAATLAPRLMAGELGAWPEQRRTRAAEVVRQSDRLQNLATSDGFLGRRVLPRVAALALRIPSIQDRIVRQIFGVTTS